MRSIVLATHDYGQGGIGMLVRCENPDELKLALGDTWEVLSENVEDHPYYQYAIERGETIYDFPNPSGMLARQIYIVARQSEGKKTFPILVGPGDYFDGRLSDCRDVWARTRQEVEEMFPGCKFLYLVPITKPFAESDIDVSDEFIEKHGKKYT